MVLVEQIVEPVDLTRSDQAHREAHSVPRGVNSRKRPLTSSGSCWPPYPAADVTPLADGLLLERSALPVAERPVVDV